MLPYKDFVRFYPRAGRRKSCWVSDDEVQKQDAGGGRPSTVPQNLHGFLSNTGALQGRQGTQLSWKPPDRHQHAVVGSLFIEKETSLLLLSWGTHLFPLLSSSSYELEAWHTSLRSIYNLIRRANEQRSIADWIRKHVSDQDKNLSRFYLDETHVM